jgi:hypothetical protein
MCSDHEYLLLSFMSEIETTLGCEVQAHREALHACGLDRFEEDEAAGQCTGLVRPRRRQAGWWGTSKLAVGGSDTSTSLTTPSSKALSSVYHGIRSAYLQALSKLCHQPVVSTMIPPITPPLRERPAPKQKLTGTLHHKLSSWWMLSNSRATSTLSKITFRPSLVDPWV